MKLITLLLLFCLNNNLYAACLSKEFENLDTESEKSTLDNLILDSKDNLNQIGKNSINYIVSQPVTSFLLFAKFFGDQNQNLDILSIFFLGQAIDAFINFLPITLRRLNSSISLPVYKKLILASFIVLCMTPILAQPFYGPQNGVGDFGLPALVYKNNNAKHDAEIEFNLKQHNIYTQDMRNCTAKWLTRNINNLNKCLKDNTLYICKNNIPTNFNKAYEFDDILNCIKKKDDCVVLWEGSKNNRNFILTSYSANSPEICFSVIEHDKNEDTLSTVKVCLNNLKDNVQLTLEDDYNTDFIFNEKFLKQLNDNEKLIKYGVTTPGSHCGLLARYSQYNNIFKNGDKVMCINFIRPTKSPDERQLCVNINNPSISEYKILKQNSGLIKIKSDDSKKKEINYENFFNEFVKSIKEAAKNKILIRHITYYEPENQQNADL